MSTILDLNFRVRTVHSDCQSPSPLSHSSMNQIYLVEYVCMRISNLSIHVHKMERN